MQIRIVEINLGPEQAGFLLQNPGALQALTQGAQPPRLPAPQTSLDMPTLEPLATPVAMLPPSREGAIGAIEVPCRLGSDPDHAPDPSFRRSHTLTRVSLIGLGLGVFLLTMGLGFLNSRSDDDDLAVHGPVPTTDPASTPATATEPEAGATWSPF